MAEVLNQALAEQIKQVAVTAASNASEKETNLIEPQAVNQMAAVRDIRQSASEAIKDNPLLAHLTSSENPLQSRAIWSAVVGIVGNLVLPWSIRLGFDIDQNDIDSWGKLTIDTIQGLSTLWAIYLALRARYASKPLFSGWFASKNA